MKPTLVAGAAALLAAAVPGAALARKPPRRPHAPPLPLAGRQYAGNAISGGYRLTERVYMDRRNPRKVAVIGAGFVCNGQGGLFTVQNPRLVLQRGRRQYHFSYRLTNNPITFISTGRQELATVTVVVDVISRTQLVGAYLVHAPDCNAGPVVFTSMRLQRR